MLNEKRCTKCVPLFRSVATRKWRKPSQQSIISSADEVVDRYAEKDAHLDENVEVGLISPDFPARNCGFRDFEMVCKVALFHPLLFAERFKSFRKTSV